MTVRTDIVRLYKDVHGWVGICSGLALFIAFYAGAITMFEDVLQHWASPPPVLAPPPPLERTPELIAKALDAHPEAAAEYDIHITTGPAQPARMSWTIGDEDHGRSQTFYATLDEEGALQVVDRGPSEVAEFIDMLHQQVGLPFPPEVSMPIMGAIALLYGVALISGVIVLLPSLVKDLFALRFGANVKRMWLDVHNVLGLFSLPFHVVMALSATVFAFHDQFYVAQRLAFPPTAQESRRPLPHDARKPLAPSKLVARLCAQAPAFEPVTLGFHKGPRGETVRVEGRDARYPMRGATFGLVTLDPYTGLIKSADYLPGHQSAAFAAVSSFFGLHFGNFGGALVRWSYFFLGLGGAFLFYTGNLLWIESRRKRERKNDAVEQTRATRILASLTVGVSLGCVAGVSTTIAAAKILPPLTGGSAPWHSAIYYAVFLSAVFWALWRGGARAGGELLIAAAMAFLLIPAASLAAASGPGWNHGGSTLAVDGAAIVAAAAALLAARRARQRARETPCDSVWNAPKGRPAASSVDVDR